MNGDIQLEDLWLWNVPGCSLVQPPWAAVAPVSAYSYQLSAISYQLIADSCTQLLVAPATHG